MKKKIFGSLIAALAVASLASCGGGSNSNTDNTGTNTGSTPVSGGDKTLVFVSTMGDKLKEVADVAVKKFEAKFPGWKIDHQTPGGYDQVKERIIGDLSASTQPDLAYCYSDHVAMYLETKKVVDMSKFIDSTETVKAVVDGSEVDEIVGFTAEEKADIVEGYFNEGYATNYEGYEASGYAATALLTLPFIKSTEALYYNADVLKELNIEVPKTWDELWSACEKIKAKYPKSTPLGYDSEANWFITMCKQSGWDYTSASKPHYLFNNANTVAFLEDLKVKFNKGNGLFITKALYGGSYTSNLFVKGVVDKSGKETGGTAFSIGSTGGASNQASDLFTWGVAPIPGVKKSDDSIDISNISQGPNLVMFKTANKNDEERQKMTWEFIKCLLEPKFQAQFSMKSGYNPVRKATYEIPAYEEWLDGNDITAVTAKMSSTITDWYFTSPAFVGSSTARDQVGAALTGLLSGTYKDATAALKKAVINCGGND